MVRPRPLRPAFLDHEKGKMLPPLAKAFPRQGPAFRGILAVETSALGRPLDNLVHGPLYHWTVAFKPVGGCKVAEPLLPAKALASPPHPPAAILGSQNVHVHVCAALLEK